MICASCGSPLPADAKFCPKCGSPTSSQSDVAAPVAQRPATKGQGLTPRAKIFWVGMAVSVLLFAVVFAVAIRPGDTVVLDNALLSALVGALLLMAFWFVVSGLLAMEDPLAEHGFRIYWIASMALTLLAVVVTLLSIGSRTPRDYLQLASDITVNGCYALGAWGLLCWRWFLQRHWLLKMALAPFAFWIFVFPARAVVYVLFVGAFGIINAVAGAVIR